MSTPRKPTQAQTAVLRNLAAGRSPTAHLIGMSAFGGYNSTRVSLQRNGWVDGGGFITDAGRAALSALSDLTPRMQKALGQVGQDWGPFPHRAYLQTIEALVRRGVVEERLNRSDGGSQWQYRRAPKADKRAEEPMK